MFICRAKKWQITVLKSVPVPGGLRFKGETDSLPSDYLWLLHYGIEMVAQKK